MMKKLSQEQGGYLEGRQILDGIILSHEAIHSLKFNKTPSMMMNMDMSKAYDQVSWTFLQ
jgi:hypothetical protein